MKITSVFYDATRSAWCIEYDNRPDRQAHFHSEQKALDVAQAQGFRPAVSDTAVSERLPVGDSNSPADPASDPSNVTEQGENDGN